MTQLQEPPFAVQVELTEGCNLRCPFCGLNGIRQPKGNDFKFMDPETLRSLMDQMVAAGWNPRVEFAMHGEPTMHPAVADMVRLARAAAPSYFMMMTSNGGGLLRRPGPAANVRALFDAGLNTLALDDYDGVGIVPKIRAAMSMCPKCMGTGHYVVLDKSETCDACNGSGVTAPALDGVSVYEYPANKDGNPHTRRKVNGRVLTFVADISHVAKGDGTHSLLNNHAGSGAPLNDSQQHSRCAKPFRELSVRWDGNVAICCNDWRGTYKAGNVVTDGLDAVWNGAAMHAARQKLVLGQRDFGPCKGCDAVSYRVGLLPDKKGQQRLPLPDAATDAAIAAAVAGAPYTPAVKRPWEPAEEMDIAT